MKKLFTILAFLLAMCVSSCNEFDDSAIWDKLFEHEEAIKDHEQRIAKLEELCKQMNTNISALQTIVEALEKSDYITNVSPIENGGEVVGYTITFAQSGTITIYNGKDGESGKDGADGQDGYTPQIGVKQASDGHYYWTVDGEWLLDEAGNMIRTTGDDGKDGNNSGGGSDGEDGEDGKDGADGADGKDGVTPRLKIENDYWYVSYDEGLTWIELGKATGEDGKDGSNGEDGADGDNIFTSVTQDDEYVYFYLADGTVIVLPKSGGVPPVDDEPLDYVKLTLPPDNEIWYTSTTGQIIELDSYPYELVSNTYVDGIGKYKFAGEVVDIDGYLDEPTDDSELINLFTSIILPSNITEIGRGGMSGLHNVSKLVLPVNLESIGVDFISGFGQYVGEKHLYFLSEKSPKMSWRPFWNQSNLLYVHYPKGSDYSAVEVELEKWKKESPLFEYEMVETTYEITYGDADVYRAPEAVDLGLSVKWASFNIGANRPEMFGHYFSWAETAPKDRYIHENYTISNKFMEDISGTEKDAARVNWGGDWRMPTKAEMQELVDDCDWEWSLLNGVQGMRVTGPSGNSIFLPAAGYRTNDILLDVGVYGLYWSSTYVEIWYDLAEHIYFYEGFRGTLGFNRFYGEPIRPVCD